MRMIKKNSVLSVVAALVISGSAMFGASNVKVYATVNGDDITSTDIALVLKDPRIQFETLPEQNKKQILNQLIERKILGVQALKTDVVNDTIYKTTLAKTVEVLKQDLALQMWMQKLSQKVVVKDEDIKKYYNDNKSQFRQPLQLKASHILVGTKDEAKKIISQLNSAKELKETFTALAKEKSTGPSGKSGGELGWFSLEKMVPEFSSAAASLKVGSITKEPVKTQFGFHIILLDDKKEATSISYEQSKDKIQQFLGQNQFKTDIDAVIKKLKAKAKIIYK